MKSLFIRVVLAFVAFLALLAVIGSLLPRDFHVKASIDIDAPASVVFDQINNLENWPSWSAWNSNDIPNLVILSLEM